MEKPPKIVAVVPKSAGRDPDEYTGRFTFYTLVVIIAGATTGLLLGYVFPLLSQQHSSLCLLMAVVDESVYHGGSILPFTRQV